MVDRSRLDAAQAPGFPERDLAVAHFVNLGCGYSAVEACADCSRALWCEGCEEGWRKWDNEGRETYLGTSMDFRNSYCVSPHPRIEQLNLPMPTVRHKERTSRVERQTLYSIPVPTQHALRILRTSQIPQLDHMFRRSSRKDIVRGRVPRDLAETSRRAVDSEYLLGRSLRLLNLQHPTHQMR